MLNQMNNFKYKTNLEAVLEDLYWINRNIEIRYILSPYLKTNTKWSKIPPKIKTLNEYYNFRQNKLIGQIKRLSSIERSYVTEHFKQIKPEVKELIYPAILNQDNILQL